VLCVLATVTVAPVGKGGGWTQSPTRVESPCCRGTLNTPNPHHFGPAASSATLYSTVETSQFGGAAERLLNIYKDRIF
jgi:hypothetical protein